MKSFEIALDHRDHVNTLVNATNRYPYTITLRQGRYVVDAKSLLGIWSLEHSKPITLEAYSNNCEALMSDLRQLIC